MTTSALRNAVQIPPRICLACFNAQQQFAFPFLVYCEHHAVLAVAHSRTDHEAFACEPGELSKMRQKFQRGELSERSSP
jgi:hypothetical protein